MSLIPKAAYLEICPDCGQHGQIVFADGERSESFSIKTAGQLTALVAVSKGLMTSEEGAWILGQIRGSSLPDLALGAAIAVSLALGALEEVQGSVPAYVRPPLETIRNN